MRSHALELARLRDQLSEARRLVAKMVATEPEGSYPNAYGRIHFLAQLLAAQIEVPGAKPPQKARA